MECYAAVCHKIITSYTSQNVQVSLCIDSAPEMEECLFHPELLDHIFIILSFENERLRWFRTTVSHQIVRDQRTRDDLENIGIEIFFVSTIEIQHDDCVSCIYDAYVYYI